MWNLWKSRHLERWGIPVLIFLLAFLSRAIYPVTRAGHWQRRAIHFSDALLARNWAETYQRYHPGVTTMWLSGIGLKFFSWQRGLTSEQLLNIAPTKPGTLDSAVAAGVLPLAFVVALCVAWSYLLLRRIAGRRAAFTASCLLALDPFCITYSKEIHVNALLTAFMITSSLFLFNHLYQERRLDLILSGVFAGLAFLSKTPTLFLVPYAVLAMVLYKLMMFLESEGTKAGWRGWVNWLWAVVSKLLIWGMVAVVTFVALWPAMWVGPLDVLRKMEERTIFHVEMPHPNPVFFNDQVTLEDPGLAFYLATIAWKTTLVTLPMACAALIFALLGLRRGRYRKIVWLLVVYVVFFTIQMGMGEKKQVSYILPVFPALDILAAFGLVQVGRAVGRVRCWKKWRWAPIVLPALALALQAGIVLPRHPYYGTHYNDLLGGARVAQHILLLQDQAEGLDLAAQYLNVQPRAQRSVAVVQARNADPLKRKFVGLTSTVSDPRATYRVYDINQIQSQVGSEEWREAWNVDRQAEPLWSVAFDGVTYVWLYGAPPEAPAAGGPEYKVDCQLGEHIQLQRVRLSATALAPGDTLTVVAIWKSDGQVEQSYTVFCHLLSANRKLVAQQDGLPLYGVRPTPSWRDGEVIEDSYEIFLGNDLLPGEYELSIGMYELESMERLPAYNIDGERLPQDRVVLGSLRVETPGTSRP